MQYDTIYPAFRYCYCMSSNLLPIFSVAGLLVTLVKNSQCSLDIRFLSVVVTMDEMDEHGEPFSLSKTHRGRTRD